MKICSLYGAGFYYIPGTDMCLKIGGWVRAEYAYGDNGAMSWGWANGNRNNRGTHDSTWRSRGYITADSRNQSEYGTIRSYIAVGLNDNNTDGAPPGFSANRAFIQFAGFTFGLTQSFFDFYSTPATAFWGGYPGSDTGDPGWKVMAYTAQLGGGLSATISAEMRRMTQVHNGVTALIGPTNYYAGFQAPDLVANLRINQAWGSAQIMGALHQVSANYYGGANAVTTGHPDDKWGFAAGAGLKLFAPMIGAGDYLQAQITYTQGALRYTHSSVNSNWYSQDGAQFGYGILSDAVFNGTTAATGTELELTTAWTLNAAYEHYWNKQWKTSAYGGYSEVSFNDNANSYYCAGAARSVCDQNWSTFWAGTRTQYNISRDTYLGLDVMYANLYSANNGSGLTTDVDNWQFRFRVHKDFYP